MKILSQRRQDRIYDKRPAHHPRIDYIEQMGTGIMRIKKAAKDAKVAMPKFELDGFFKVTFKRIDSQAVAKRLKNPVKNDKKQGQYCKSR